MYKIIPELYLNKKKIKFAAYAFAGGGLCHQDLVQFHLLSSQHRHSKTLGRKLQSGPSKILKMKKKIYSLKKIVENTFFLQLLKVYA